MAPTRSEPPAGAGAHLGARAGASAGMRKITSKRVQGGAQSRIANPKSKAEMSLNKAEAREKEVQYGVAFALVKADPKQNGAIDCVLKLRNDDGSARFPLVKGSTLRRRVGAGGASRTVRRTTGAR